MSPPPRLLPEDLPVVLAATPPEQRLAAVFDFTTRCRAWAAAEIERRRAVGRATDEWELYLRFTDHTLKELGDGTLDHWFSEKP